MYHSYLALSTFELLIANQIGNQPFSSSKHRLKFELFPPLVLTMCTGAQEHGYY